MEVYFDDFRVEHVRSPVVSSQDYYPFGLTYNNYSREKSLANQYKFQGQEQQDELDLGWESFKWRNYIPEIGRFFNVDPLSEKYLNNSPYAFSENKIASHVELEGLESVDIKQDATSDKAAEKYQNVKASKQSEKKSAEVVGPKRWTGLDFLNFLDGEKKEQASTKSDLTIIIYSDDGGGPDEEHLSKADKLARILDINADVVSALTATFGKGLKRTPTVPGESVAEGMNSATGVIQSAKSRDGDRSEETIPVRDMKPGTQYYCPKCTELTGDTVIVNTNMNSNQKNKHDGGVKIKQ